MAPRIAVVGAGITGLSLAYFLQERYGLQAALFEKADRCGGWIATYRKNGFLFEKGPRGIRPFGTGADTVDLINSLGLQNQVVEAKALRRYFLRKGKLCSILHPRLIFAFAKDIAAKKSNSEDESIFSFANRRFGKFFAENYADPIVAGIFAGDPHKLSVKSCFPEIKDTPFLWQMLRKNKGKGRSNAALLSFKNGMQTLTDTLALKLADSLEFNQRLVGIRCAGSEIVLKFGCGRERVFDKVFLSLPPKELALLGCFCPIEAVSLAVVNIGYHGHVLSKKGFGYLIGKNEMEAILGVVFDSEIFPDQHKDMPQTRLSVMIGGARAPFAHEWGDEVLKEIALEAINRHLGITRSPDLIEVQRASNAIAQYEVGHESKIARIKEFMYNISPHIEFLGAGFDGVAVNNCIAIAKKRADHYIKNK